MKRKMRKKPRLVSTEIIKNLKKVMTPMVRITNKRSAKIVLMKTKTTKSKKKKKNKAKRKKKRSTLKNPNQRR